MTDHCCACSSPCTYAHIEGPYLCKIHSIENRSGGNTQDERLANIELLLSRILDKLSDISYALTGDFK